MKTLAGFALAVSSFSLAGCAAALSGPAMPSPEADTIAVSRGPCFGFCPVYTLSVAPSGRTTFDGARHTAMLGFHARDAGVDGYRRVANALAAFRPATGTTRETRCDTRISDQQHFTVTWTAPGGSVTTLEHDRGCRSDENDALDTVLDAVPAQLGVHAWVAQLTRPGATRG